VVLTDLKKGPSISQISQGRNRNQLNWRDDHILNLSAAMRKVVDMASPSAMFHFRSVRISSLLDAVRKLVYMINYWLYGSTKNILIKMTIE